MLDLSVDRPRAGCYHAWRMRRVALCALLPLVAACGPSYKAVNPAPFPPEAVAAVERSEPITLAPIVDPVIALIAESDHYFRQGQSELEAGHVEGARLAFDRALGVLLESPGGGMTGGVRYARPYADRAGWAATALYSIHRYKLFEVGTTSPGHCVRSKIRESDCSGAPNPVPAPREMQACGRRAGGLFHSSTAMTSGARMF